MNLSPLNTEEAALLNAMFKKPDAEKRKALAYLRMSAPAYRTVRHRERNLDRVVDSLTGLRDD